VGLNIGDIGLRFGLEFHLEDTMRKVGVKEAKKIYEDEDG